MRMADWHLTLWSIQYVVAVLPTLSITIYLYIKNKKILSYQIFFIFGVFLSTWLLFVFLHRIAPTEKLSEHFFRAGMFFCPLANPLIFLAILSLGKLKNWCLDNYSCIATFSHHSVCRLCQCFLDVLWMDL